MKRASAYMFDSVSHRGGFVQKYTEDLSERWGEVPAREAMVWVQSPGTVSVGQAQLEAYRATGDKTFLDYAKRTADGLVAGQKPAGGWHYFIDFEPEKTENWYQTVGSKCWGWEEFYHFYDNATFDDNTTIGAATFLLDLYTTSKDEAYKAPLMKAIQFVLDAQYPVGGWPQRYPLQTDYHPEPITDYSSYLTYNDNVTVGCIDFLIKAHGVFDEPAYLAAARRGMYFVILSQYGAPQAGWAQQYSLDLEPGAARNYEPASLSPSTTIGNVQHLLRFYKMTGDTRFLRGIPDALTWLKYATLPDGHSEDGHTHAMFVEVGTGKPLYAHREGTDVDHGRYWVDYEPRDFPGHYGMQFRFDVSTLRAQVDGVTMLSPTEARAAYAVEQAAQPAKPTPSADAVQAVLDGLNPKGAWIEEVSVKDYSDWKFKPGRTFPGISTRTFTNNLLTLAHYVRSLQQAEAQ